MKIMLLGANGFTGRRILQRLSRNHQVVACSLHPDILPEEGYQFETLNMQDFESMNAIQLYGYHRRSHIPIFY